MIISVTGIIFLRNIKTSIVVMVTRVFFAVRTEFILFRRTPSSGVLFEVWTEFLNNI